MRIASDEVEAFFGDGKDTAAVTPERSVARCEQTSAKNAAFLNRNESGEGRSKK